MKYYTEIQSASASPRQLEELYQSALMANDAEAFKEALEVVYHESPEDILFSTCASCSVFLPFIPFSSVT